MMSEMFPESMVRYRVLRKPGDWNTLMQEEPICSGSAKKEYPCGANADPFAFLIQSCKNSTADKLQDCCTRAELTTLVCLPDHGWSSAAARCWPSPVEKCMSQTFCVFI